MSDTLKRLEEIEAALSGFKRRVNYDDIGWLCTRLRDALAVIGRYGEPWDATKAAAYRRLFGEEAKRGK